MTKRAMFEALSAFVMDSYRNSDKNELLAAIDHELEQLNKKAATAKTTPTKQQLANMELRKTILRTMQPAAPMTVSDILAALGDPTLTNQRVTHVLTAMVTDNLVTREVIKRKAYYTVEEA